jgi:hypothetical protein
MGSLSVAKFKQILRSLLWVLVLTWHLYADGNFMDSEFRVRSCPGHLPYWIKSRSVEDKI